MGDTAEMAAAAAAGALYDKRGNVVSVAFHLLFVVLRMDIGLEALSDEGWRAIESIARRVTTRVRPGGKEGGGAGKGGRTGGRVGKAGKGGGGRYVHVDSFMGECLALGQ